MENSGFFGIVGVVMTIQPLLTGAKEMFMCILLHVGDYIRKFTRPRQ